MKWSNGQLVTELLRVMAERLPRLKIIYKNTSALHWVLALLVWPFNRRYMKQYWTPLGYTLAVPSPRHLIENQWHVFYTLAHVYVHLWDYQRNPLRYIQHYLMPQLLAAFSLFALLAVHGSLAWLTFLVFLAALGPWRSRGRTHLELRGYAMNTAIDTWVDGRMPSDQAQERRATFFSSMEYLRMCPERASVLRALDWYAEQAVTGALCDHEAGTPYRDVLALLVKAGVYRPAPHINGASCNARDAIVLAARQ